MKKMIITYVALFLGCFAVGLVLAFSWQKIFSKQHSADLPPAPPVHDSVPAAASAQAKPSALNIPLTLPSRTAQAQPLAGPVAPVQVPQPTGPLPEAPKRTAGSAIVLLIDSSGSMKRTDPANYRKEASKLLISLLGPDDVIGVMRFGDAAVMMHPLAQNTEQNRTALFAAVDKITPNERSTNITDAVQQGFEALKKAGQHDRLLFLMSDGKLALGSADRDTASLNVLNGLLPELAKAGIRLHTVAFTGESDSKLLERMARETGGSFRFARTDKDVHGMFATLFEKIKSPDTVPFEGESFSLDSRIKEATVVVTKKPGIALALMDPLSRKHDASSHAANITWFGSSVFDLITIRGPAAGAWSVKLSANDGNKVYIATDLSLKTSFDRSFVPQGEHLTIEAWLEQGGTTVTERGLLESTVFTAAVTGPDGETLKHGLVSAMTPSASASAEGRYSLDFSAQAAGEYRVSFQAQGKTFKREKAHQFKTVEPAAEPATQKANLPVLVKEHLHAQDEAVLWTAVLMRFALVNLVVIVLGSGGYMVVKKISRKRGLAA